MKKYDFSGYATKNDLKCSDGRTIRKDAFKDNDGHSVPLVWQHLHNDSGNVLGHAILENREDGVYTYGKFNDTEAGRNAKLLVEHKDITKLSIYANDLLQQGSDVIHGAIREVSLVLSGANPGAVIDNLSIQHSDGSVDTEATEAIIHTGSDLELPTEEEEMKKDDIIEHAEDEETVKEVFDTLSDKQKEVVYYMIGAAVEGGEEDDDDDDDVEHSEGGYAMKRNIFDNTDELVRPVLSHSDLKSIFEDAQKTGSLKESFLSHAVEYGIEDIDYLFPDAKTLTSTPEFIARRMEWVAGVISGTKHTPFSRIKTVGADITADEARAKGYVKGNLKKEEVVKLLKRSTSPTTIYKKQKLDRDDIIDITDLDVVAWLKAEMRVMLDEELARAVLIGDGRDAESDDKIDEACIRPIVSDDNLYAHLVTLAANCSGNDIIEGIIRARTYYKGSGTPTLYTTDKFLIDLLLLKDTLGRRLYTTETELAQALRVSKIVCVEPMEGVDNLVGIVVNLQDYSLGADKGGNISMFDDFDIDYNQYKYLLETRCSGALTKYKSALVIKREDGTSVTPTAPTFVAATGVITIPTKLGVVYSIDGVAVEAGAQEAVVGGVTAVVTAAAITDYYIPANTTVSWSFLSELAAG